ncbi:MAG TPA: T9SS type A sorting domain-containing protein [Chitinophagales bacterium]|nr:T9SS type A sorting domain-containing protein [Chitinophagales bacterium]
MNTNKTFIKISVISLFALLFSFQYSIAHWSTKGPYGGHVSAYTVIDSFLYLGSPTGGVYTSTNTQFTNWSYRNYTGLTSGNITGLSHIGYKLIAATGDSGIYISNDKGVTWAISNNMLTNRSLTSVVSSNGNIFAGSDGGGVFMSGDSGTTWMAMNTNLTNLHITCLAASGDTIFAGTAGGGVFISLNGGGAWVGLTTNLTDLNITAIAYSSGNLFAGTASGVFQATVSTLVWSAVNTGLANTHINALMVAGDSVYAATNMGVSYSQLTSVSWMAAGSLMDTIHALGSYGTKIFAGSANNGTWKATTGVYSWSAYNTGFNNLESYAICALDSTVAVSNEQGVFVCNNYILSAVYVKHNTGLDDSLHVNALGITANHTLYAGTANNGVYVSTDSGATWATANTGLNNMAVKKLLVTRNKIYLATVDGKVYSTLQSSISWSLTGSGLPANLDITAMANAGDTVFVGSANGVYVSIGGASWTGTGLNQDVTSLAYVGGSIFAGTAGAGVFKASLSNPTWVSVAALPSQNITALGASTGNGSTDVSYLLAAYYGGGEASCNEGQTWHPFNVYLYNPNYSRVSAFATITPRVYALNPHHGPLSNAKTEYPVVMPDTPSVIISSPASICEGSTVSFSVSNDAEASMYTWMLPNGWTGSSTSGTINATVNNTGGYVMVTASNGCGMSAMQMDSFAVNPMPMVMTMISTTSICNNASPLSLTGGMPSGGTYSGNGVTNSTFDPASAGVGTTYVYYTYTSPAGCTGADSTAITVNNCTGIDNIAGSLVSVYPNPFSNQLSIKTSAIENGTLTLMDVTGKVVQTVRVNTASGVTVINTSRLEKGIYMLNIIGNNQIAATRKVVKTE